MLQILVNCGDGYTDAATLGPNKIIKSVAYSVSAPNYAICQLARRLLGGNPVWDEGEFALQPGQGQFNDCYGMRFRNFKAGQQSVVQATAFLTDDPIPVGAIPSSIVFTPAGQTGGGITSNVAPTPLASFPPSNPSDGDLSVLELPASYDPVGGKPIRWLCSYDAAIGAWNVIGPDLYAEVLTSETTASAVYADLATVGPAITLPRPGDYVIRHGFNISSETATTGSVLMSYSGAGIVAADANAALSTVSAVQFTQSVHRTQEQNGLTTASPVTAKYRVTANTIGFANRWLAISPLRIS